MTGNSLLTLQILVYSFVVSSPELTAAIPSDSYQAGQLKILEVRAGDGQDLVISFQVMAETLYHCPGANSSVVDDTLELTFVRAGLRDQSLPDQPVVRTPGSAKLEITVPRKTRIFMRSGAVRQLLFDPEKQPQGPKRFDVTVKGRQGFINESGRLVIPAIYEKVFPFSDGLAAVQTDGLWGFIDVTGKVVIPPQFRETGLFQSGRARVRVNDFSDPFGYINRAGKMVIKSQYDWADDFRNGVARVGRASLSDQIISTIADVGVVCEYHYIDRMGTKVPKPPANHYARGTKDELLPFAEGDRFGFIDASGKVVLPPKYVAASAFSEGLACVREQDLYGFIDRSGHYVIPPRYPFPNDFSDGVVGVPLKHGSWGFVDRTGTPVMQERFSWIYGGFRHGLAKVVQNRKVGYINRQGDWIWRPTD